MFYLDADRAQIDVYNMGWKLYQQQREADEKRRKRERQNAEKKAAALNSQADKMRAKATKTVAAQNMASRADSLLSGLEAVRDSDKVAELRFPEPAPCGKTPLMAEGLSKSYGSLEIFTDVDLAIDKGSRVVILGLNGAGKTTLLRLLGGAEKPDTGQIIEGHGLKLGYYAQEHETLDPDRTVLENMRSAAPDLDLVQVRKTLGCSSSPATTSTSRPGCSPAARRPGSRSRPWSSPRPTCSCSTSRRTTSTRPAARRSSARCAPTRAPSSWSPTTRAPSRRSSRSGSSCSRTVSRTSGVPTTGTSSPSPDPLRTDPRPPPDRSFGLRVIHHLREGVSYPGGVPGAHPPRAPFRGLAAPYGSDLPVLSPVGAVARGPPEYGIPIVSGRSPVRNPVVPTLPNGWPGSTGGVIMRVQSALPIEEARVAETLKKGSRVTGAARDKLAADLKKKYDSGASIRALAEETGRSYGFVHRMLSESGVTLRGRGGATRGKKAASA
ncbi:hypothetical protein SCYAM73S_00893 [Streptomyces cyaneofuscatus]